MRAGIPIFFSSLILAVALSCKPEKLPDNGENTNPPTETPGQQGEADNIALSEAKVCFSAYGGSRVVTVTSESPDWKATSSAAWLSTSADDNQLTISVSENKETISRKATVTVSAAGGSACVTIEQDGHEENAVPEEAQLNYTLSEDAVIAPKSLAQYITKTIGLDDGSRYFFFVVDKSIPAELMPEVGTKLVVNTPTEVIPDGFAGHVDNIYERPDGFEFSCTKLEVTDIFKEAEKAAHVYLQNIRSRYE